MAPKKKTTAEVAEAPQVQKTAAAEPAAKKAKVEEKPVEKPVVKKPLEKVEATGAPAEPDKAKEQEVDAKKDSGPRVRQTISFDTADSTLNVVPTMNGRVLTCLTDGGMQYLIAGARANVGIKAGRYMYEVKIIETILESGGKSYLPKQVVRVGFSTSDSSLILGDGGASVYFDDMGAYCDGDVKGVYNSSRKFGRDVILGLLLNLDEKTPNANTVSLFKNGVRSSEPMKLPDALLGTPLFPHVSFRNVSLQVHFGPELLKPLPFICRGLQDATATHVSIVKAAEPKGGKYEVVLPVGFPDEGTFAWLDGFLEKNPQYTELSDRKIIEWATKSGVSNRSNAGQLTSNDKPTLGSGIPSLDDFSVRRVINTMASIVPRNYLVMEVKQNLIPADRKANLNRFPSALFTKVAKVVMGEPNKDFKKLVRVKLLKVKQDKAELAWKAKKVEKERSAAAEKRKRDILEKQAALKKGAVAKSGGEEKEEDDGTKVEEAMKDESDVECPVVTLTEDEEKQHFCRGIVPDLQQQVFDKNFAAFAIPQKDEGFDSIEFLWQKEKESNAYLRKWVLERKRTSLIDDLRPGEWFKTKRSEWLTSLEAWMAKQREAKMKTSAHKDEEEDMDSLDVFGVQDVNDIGGGLPLYMEFGPEDWALMRLRFEIFALAEAYRKDVNDPDRVEILEQHVNVYFNKYFNAPFSPKIYGKDTFADLLKLIKDTAKVSEQGTLSLVLDAARADSLDFFVKLTEEARRERQRRIDAGDETARLKLPPQALKQGAEAQTQAPQAATQATQVGALVGGSKQKGKGKGKK